MWPGSVAFAGGLMVGRPFASSVMRSSRSVAARTANPSGAERLKATANGLVLKSFVPTGSKLTPTFMLSVVPLPKASTSAAVSIVERQLWTLTLKRKGKLGDEQVTGTSYMSPRKETESSSLGQE